jgi:hypothetical protein
LHAIARFFALARKTWRPAASSDQTTEDIMRFQLFIAILGFAACANLPIPGFLNGSSQTQQHRTETSSSTETHDMHVNGKTVDLDHTADADEQPHASRKSRTGDIGKTCHHNSDCAGDDGGCFVGYGNLGYCTKMCNSFSDCPMHWDCKKPGNAPQRICMQDAD